MSPSFIKFLLVPQIEISLVTFSLIRLSRTVTVSVNIAIPLTPLIPTAQLGKHECSSFIPWKPDNGCTHQLCCLFFRCAAFLRHTIGLNVSAICLVVLSCSCLTHASTFHLPAYLASGFFFSWGWCPYASLTILANGRKQCLKIRGRNAIWNFLTNEAARCISSP